MSSNLFPRINFRISDCIYFAIGNFDHKTEPRYRNQFEAPLDYLNYIKYYTTYRQNSTPCELINKFTKTFSNHILLEND
jgi:hypothetical protein